MQRTFLCLLLAFFSLAAAPAPAPAPALTEEQKTEAKARLEEYKQSAFDMTARRSVIRDVLKMPAAVQKVFLGVVDADLAKALPLYRTEFQKETDKLAKSRDTKETRDEIKRLRASVLGLRALGDALTKEKIVEIGDPALQRLQELMSFNRAMVFKNATGLDIPRERLVTLLQCREDLRKALGIADGKEFPPEKLLAEETALTEKAPPYEREAIKIMEANKKLQANVPPEEAHGVLATNELRAILGLSALVIDPKLCDAARGHSKDMVDHKFFAHESPVPGKKSPWDRAKLAGTSASAENIYAGSARPEDAVMAWWHSPGHHVNMLNPGHKRMAMGRHEGHWTQLFGG